MQTEGPGPASAARPVSGLVLAAGASTRMGRPKQLLPLGDACVLQHVIDAAARSCLDEIVLVLGHRAADVRSAIRLPARPPVRVVVNPEPGRGLSSSIRLGLASVAPGTAAIAILLGDQPQVHAALIDRVVRAFLGGGARAVRPVYSGPGGERVPGHPVLLAQEIWSDVSSLSGDEGARRVLSAHPDWVLEVPVDGPPPADLDTLEDYERALEAAREGTSSRDA
jgi:molybdenum cofactor cytidylyltransferase